MGKQPAIAQPLALHELAEFAASELKKIKPQSAKDGVMKFAECTVELAVTAEREASGGLKFWIIEAGGKVKGGDSSRIVLKFVALGGERDVVLVAQDSEPRKPTVPARPSEPRK